MEMNESNKNGALLVRDSHGRVVKGSVLNPYGRPKKHETLTDITKQILEEELPDGKTRKEHLVRKVLELAQKGNETFVKLAWQYVDGMPKQQVEHSGTVEHHVTYEEALRILEGEIIDDTYSDAESKDSEE